MLNQETSSVQEVDILTLLTRLLILRLFLAQIRRTIGSAPAQPAELLFLMGTVTSGPDNTFALLFFGTDQLGIPIQPGFYPDAQRADFAEPGHPGLDVGFQNTGQMECGGSLQLTTLPFHQT